jgi:hypothetical protein
MITEEIQTDEIISEVQKHTNARVFAYGIGNSVNRFLIEAMAKAGRGDSEVVTLNDKADAAAHRLYERLRAPLLTDVSIDWRGLPVTDVFPKQLPDLFSGKPLVLSGRYTAAANGTTLIRGKRAGEEFTREIPINLSGRAVSGGVLSSFWARRKIDDLMSQDWAGLQSGNVKPEVQKEITELGLSYKLMTQFTSFVAVEERVVTTNGTPHRVEIPVEMPEGVTYEGVFGGEKDAMLLSPNAGLTMFAQLGKTARISGNGAIVMRKMVAHNGSAVGSGSGAGVGGGVAGGVPPSPPPPMVAMPNIATLPQSSSQLPDEKPAGERAIMESKLSPALLEAFDCWKKQTLECKLPEDGTVEIELFLTEDSAAVIELIKPLGFAVSQDRPKEKAVVGRLPIGKLVELAKMESVRFVAQARR